MRKFLVLAILFSALPQPSSAGSACAKGAWEKVVDVLVTGQTAFVRGDPAMLMGLWSPQV
jgi:hypothetical protein